MTVTRLQEVRISLKDKNIKRLIALTVAMILLIVGIVFFTALLRGYYSELKLMDQFVLEVPKIVDSRVQEFNTRSGVYAIDVQARGELGRKLYEEEKELEQDARLELVRSTVDAAGVSLVDGGKRVLATTGSAAPAETFQKHLEALESNGLVMMLYQDPPQEGEETGKDTGAVLTMIPLADSKRSLVFEFPCESLIDIYYSLSDWPGVLKRMLSGVDGLAAAKSDNGDLAVYPRDGFTEEELTQLEKELNNVFADSDSFRDRGDNPPSKRINLLGRPCVAVMRHYPEASAKILLTGAFEDLVNSSLYTASALAGIIALGMILFQVYMFRRLLQEKGEEGSSDAGSKKLLSRKGLPGMIAVILATSLFAGLLLMLENRATNATVAMTKRETVQYEVDWHEQQTKLIREKYAEIYQTRAQALANYVTLHPETLTHSGLAELNALSGTEYLMLFDRYGQELASSNSYTGFTVGGNLSEEYRAVLLGYPSITVGPANDPYNGQPQLGAAILLKDTEGQPDGFLLAVFDAQTLQDELISENLENTVNNFAVQDGHLTAVVNDEDGRFIAHTNQRMIGQRAADHLKDYTPGSDYEGFSKYDDKNVYVSGSSNAGKGLLFIVPDVPDPEVRSGSMKLIVGLMLLIMLYCLRASLLCQRAARNVRVELPDSRGKNNSLIVFANGYMIFLSLLAICAWILSAEAMWPAFSFVFSRKWSNGFHLFSVWMALLVLAGTLSVVFIARTILAGVEIRLTLRTRTITRLIDSLICYGASLFLLFYILNMFGVNTAALLASAGIISIAVGMGAQSLASDILAGFFMMMEGSIHVGDYVSVSGVTGTVTDMGIRNMEITDDDQNVVLLNNSHVSNVVNMNRNHPQEEREQTVTDQLAAQTEE